MSATILKFPVKMAQRLPGELPNALLAADLDQCIKNYQQPIDRVRFLRAVMFKWTLKISAFHIWAIRDDDSLAPQEYGQVMDAWEYAACRDAIAIRLARAEDEQTGATQ